MTDREPISEYVSLMGECSEITVYPDRDQPGWVCLLVQHFGRGVSERIDFSPEEAAEVAAALLNYAGLYVIVSAEMTADYQDPVIEEIKKRKASASSCP